MFALFQMVRFLNGEIVENEGNQTDRSMSKSKWRNQTKWTEIRLTHDYSVRKQMHEFQKKVYVPRATKDLLSERFSVHTWKTVQK